MVSFSTLCLFLSFLCVVPPAFTATLETPRTDETLSKNSNTRKGVHGALIYPTDLKETTGALNRGGDTSLETSPSPCPDDALFCESADDYPKETIKKKLKKQPKLLLDILYEEDLDDVHNKFGPEPGNEKELCTSTAKIVYPNKAKSKEGLFEFVVNDDEHRQGIRVETCTTAGGECNEMPSHVLPLGYRSSCVQKYIQRTLVVLNRNSTSGNSTSDVQGFVTKPFEFPSCCSCVIKMSVPGYDRFGDDETTPATSRSMVKVEKN